MRYAEIKHNAIVNGRGVCVSFWVQGARRKNSGYKGDTLQYIFMGKRRKELTQNFITPIRQHLEENREIFNKLYGGKEGC